MFTKYTGFLLSLNSLVHQFTIHSTIFHVVARAADNLRF